MLGETNLKFIQEAKKLREFSQEMEMAIHYKKFDYGYFDRLLGQVIEENATAEERQVLRPWEKKSL